MIKQSLWPQNFPLPDKKIQDLTQKLRKSFTQKLSDLHLPTGLSDELAPLYLPLALWIEQFKQMRGPLVLGINGGQGSGKSTITELLSLIFQLGFGWQVAALSIDDLYLTRQERLELGEKIHPLFKARGVPGTHDVALGIRIINQLKAAKAGEIVYLPSFNKAKDDREPCRNWKQVQGSIDIIILEGWCVGALPQEASQLEVPLNQLEKEEDRDAQWRIYANQRLAADYQRLFQLVDLLVMLKVPSMEKIFEWRGLQEAKLIQQVGAGNKTMDPPAIRRFIMHYERLTRYMLTEMPSRAAMVLHLNNQHQIFQATFHGNPP